MNHSKVIYFDGVCGLCNGFVDVFIKLDTKRLFRFATLQGAHAAEHLQESERDLSTVIYQRGEQVFQKSTAVLNALADLGGAYTLLKLFLVVPVFLRDFLYDLVANNRYSLFGERESCRLPSPEERELFWP